MKRQIAILATAMLLFASGCTKEGGTETSFAQTAASTDMDNAGTRPSAGISDENRTDGSRILIAYFTR